MESEIGGSKPWLEFRHAERNPSDVGDSGGVDNTGQVGGSSGKTTGGREGSAREIPELNKLIDVGNEKHQMDTPSNGSLE